MGPSGLEVPFKVPLYVSEPLPRENGFTAVTKKQDAI